MFLRRSLPVLPVCSLLLVGGAARAQAPADVPANHWARAAVASVVSRGVMPAANGRFDGGRRVTRRDLAITLARLARSLQAGKWPTSGAAPLRRRSAAAAPASDRAITRYELAAAIDRVARQAAQGLPAPGRRTFGKSEALPPPSRLVGVSRSDPAYESLVYLTTHRMLWRPSPLLAPSSTPVKPSEAADALAMLIVGINDQRTDEPELRPELSEPPSKSRTPARRPAGPA